MKINLPVNVNYIINELNKCGYEAYVVGGCVRDSIIGLVPHDWDICTSALPEQIVDVFCDHKIIPTGIKHGTVTVVIEDEQYEVTTYRIDGEYEDNRHPTGVTFTNSIKDDLKRRDFTINAMAYSPSVGLVDFFGGKKDIKNKVIKCVGKPDDRFNEDALRILRAIRFSITLGYNIEQKTLRSIYENKKLLKNISVERINAEITKALSCGYSIAMGKILQVVIPELTDKMVNDAMTMVGIFDTSLNVRIALVFNFDERKQKEILQRLKFDNKTIKKVCGIRKLTYNIRKYKDEELVPPIIMKRVLSYNNTIANDVISALRCTSYLDGTTSYYVFADKMSECLQECKNECYKISHLKVNGEDMKAIGFFGEKIGIILNALLSAVIEECIPNEYDALIGYSQNFIKLNQKKY